MYSEERINKKTNCNIKAPQYMKTYCGAEKANPTPLFGKNPNEVFKKSRKKWKN